MIKWEKILCNVFRLLKGLHQTEIMFSYNYAVKGNAEDVGRLNLKVSGFPQV